MKTYLYSCTDTKMRLFEVDSDVRKRTLQLFERTEESFDDDVKAIKKMVTYPKTLTGNNGYIECCTSLVRNFISVGCRGAKIRNFLLLNKCSVENAKQKIDMDYACTHHKNRTFNLVADTTQGSLERLIKSIPCL
jgi:hypothetical protein